jgi:hypothetical protein
MVSNTLNMTAEELLAVLERLRRDHADDPDYISLRSALPAEWPI